MDTRYSTFLFIQEAHKEQLYGDMPYYLHPLEVAVQVSDEPAYVYMAALLHDVVEDTEYDIQYVRNRWGDKIGDIVSLLTKDPDLSYMKNIERIIESGNKHAMKVKLADNLANMSSIPKKPDLYRKSISLLQKAISAKSIK